MKPEEFKVGQIIDISETSKYLIQHNNSNNMEIRTFNKAIVVEIELSGQKPKNCR